MKKSKWLAAALCLILLLGLIQPVAADGSAASLQARIEEILAYEASAASVNSAQALLDDHLSQRAGIDAEWYAVALAQYDGTLSLEAYADALLAYVSSHRITSASTRQKYALALVAAGRENTAFVRDVLNDSMGELGIMSLVFGLHLLNNGLPSEDYTAESAVEALLSRQLEDGGFAVSGTAANADVTAMVLQAIAPHTQASTAAAEATARAVDCLSALQKPDGCYESYGARNAESCAQVLMALCTLGIDPYTDARFVKNGCTVIDALEGFRTPSGGYSHEAGGEVHISATAQTLCAYVSLWRAESGKPHLYLFEDVNYDASSIIEAPTTPDEPTSDGDAARAGYQLWVSLGIGVIALLWGALLILRKRKKGLRDALLVVLTAALLIVLVMTIRVQMPEDYYGTDGDMGARIGAVTLEIRCDTVAGQADHIPTDGVMLEKTSIALYENDTAYDVLVRAAKQHRLLLVTSGGTVGASSSLYVSGVNNLCEFDFGDLSGWMYAVNGEFPSRGCDTYRLADGDAVLLLYTLTLGDDVGKEAAP